MSRPPTLLEMRRQADLMRDTAAAANGETVNWGLAGLGPAQLTRWADAVDRAADKLEADPAECRRREQAAEREWRKDFQGL